MNRITWLGQAGLLFEYEGYKVMVDPYLSHSVEKIEPHNVRRVPVDESFFDIKPDMMIFTHDHMDHYDPETVERFITEDSEITVLAPRSVFEKVLKIAGIKNNVILFEQGTRWTEGGLRFTAVKAVHSEEFAVGVVIEDPGHTFYVTGDTLYSSKVLEDLRGFNVDVLFLPVNGVGNNMNMTDGADFARAIDPDFVVPLHIGLFDSKSFEDFDCENKVIPRFYKEIDLPICQK